MNAEIIAKIDQSYQSWPKIVLSQAMQDRVSGMPMNVRLEIEQQIESYVDDLLEEYFPEPSIIETFKSFSALIADLPSDKRGKMLNDMGRLLNEAMDSMPKEKKNEYVEQLAVYLNKYK